MQDISKEELEEYIKPSLSYYEVLLRMKRDGYDVDIDSRYMTKKLINKINKYEIDVSHMKYNGLLYRHVVWCIPKDEFDKYVKDSSCFIDIIRKVEVDYKVRPSYNVITKRIKVENIDISHMNYASLNEYTNKKSATKTTKKICKLLKCKYCSTLFDIVKKRDARTICPTCKLEPKTTLQDTLTFGELKKKCKNIRSEWAKRIVMWARYNYIVSKRPLCCESCKYNKYVEICHLKGVAMFTDDTLIKDINHIDNLAALCPNCHWELDKGIRTIAEICPNIVPIYGFQQHGQKYVDTLTCKIGSNKYSTLDNMNKGSIFEKNGYTIGKTLINAHARTKFVNALKYNKCNCCNYDKHIEVCHIKAISDFSNDALIKEINAPSNLVALCRNHHKEYDKGVTKLKDLCSDEIIKVNDEYQKVIFEYNKLRYYSPQHHRQYSVAKRRIKDRPSLEQLNKDIDELGNISRVAKKYKVSFNAIKKWIKWYNDPKNKDIIYQLKNKDNLLSNDAFDTPKIAKKVKAKKFKCKLCNVKMYANKTNTCGTCYKHIKQKEKLAKSYKCKYCNKVIKKRKSSSCIACHRTNNIYNPRPGARKIKDRPSNDQLNKDLEELKTYVNVAKKYNVHVTTIRYWFDFNTKHEQQIKQNL
jgi:uncharacterized protein YjcR